MKETKNIIICGVGGQGTLLASKLIGSVCQSGGYDVKLSEVHGMSQRGGSVVSYVRYGESVASPVVEVAEADVILAFEMLEAARYLPYLKKGGLIILNDQKINPMPVIIGAAKYPEGIIEKLRDKPIDVIAVDALKLAKEAGSAKSVNVVLIGILAKHLEFKKNDWIKAIGETVPEKFREMNIKAFESGFVL
ncbi:MAG: indolepyruvate oxidoreductase subunit beta [Oscillospiraceae bacterium]|nr:indolepyruvate oxidoreductase subunit beta [Oscillospiraceae bacterium]